MSAQQINEIYQILLKAYGHQKWWPGDTPFEVAVGAILTQNTNWGNVEKAIGNLKAASTLSAEAILGLGQEKLAELIKPAGYFRVKAKRLGNFVKWLCDEYDGRLEALAAVQNESLREDLLAVNGIGPETCDSILLYALGRPIFVIDAYTARVAIRHHLIDAADADYHQLQELFTSSLPEDVQLYNEYHALLVETGKRFCKPKPKCQHCPLNHLPHTVEFETY